MGADVAAQEDVHQVRPTLRLAEPLSHSTAAKDGHDEAITLACPGPALQKKVRQVFGHLSATHRTVRTEAIVHKTLPRKLLARVERAHAHARELPNRPLCHIAR